MGCKSLHEVPCVASLCLPAAVAAKNLVEVSKLVVMTGRGQELSKMTTLGKMIALLRISTVCGFFGCSELHEILGF